MVRNNFGWFGWLSAVGFVVLGTLYLLDLAADELWQFPRFWTLVIAIVAGIGALALYVGNDPTAETRRETRTEA